MTTTTILKPASIELHLNPGATLPKRFGERIKAAGGRYSHCRGNAYRRYVTLPLSERDLINELAAEFFIGASPRKGLTMIFRGGTAHHAPAWVTVQYIDKSQDMLSAAESALEASAQKARARGII